jgi:calcineurin-like phosphoesterase family protein
LKERDVNQKYPGSAYSLRLHQTFTRPAGLRLQRPASAHGHQPFRPLPAPTGAPPYHLDLADVLPPDQIKAISDSGRLVFHVVGDTGGIQTPVPQENVARQMEEIFHSGAGPRPSFFYHLGDVVYFYGESEQYYPQFYEPYSLYPAPIFAIPGNHDGDLSRDMEAQKVPSLNAFVNNFCVRIPHHTPDALDDPRHAMTQPNVYWTLETPLAIIIGLYTNVPEGGRLDDDQIIWLHEELKEAPPERALIVAMHHPIYSLDDHHSGSEYMQRILEDAVQQVGRMPDAVFSGHVHNYQRFTRPMQSGHAVPYIVAGAGGYHNLHRVPRSLKDPAQQLPYEVPDSGGVTLETFCDDRFGFLQVEVTSDALKGDYYTVPGFQDPASGQATLFDAFSFDLKARKVATMLPEELRRADTSPRGGSPGQQRTP